MADLKRRILKEEKALQILFFSFQDNVTAQERGPVDAKEMAEV